MFSFVPFYGLGISRVRNRFRSILEADTLSVRVVTVFIGSVLYGALGLLTFRFWWTLMEGMRVGNPDGHFGFRAAALNYWSTSYAIAWLVVGALAFLVVALVSRGCTEEPIAFSEIRRRQ